MQGNLHNSVVWLAVSRLWWGPSSRVFFQLLYDYIPSSAKLSTGNIPFLVCILHDLHGARRCTICSIRLSFPSFSVVKAGSASLTVLHNRRFYIWCFFSLLSWDLSFSPTWHVFIYLFIIFDHLDMNFCITQLNIGGCCSLERKASHFRLFGASFYLIIE